MLMLVRGSGCLRLGVLAGDWGFDVRAGFLGGIVEDYWVEWVFLAGSRGGEVSLVVCVVLEMWESWFRMRSLLY